MAPSLFDENRPFAEPEVATKSQKVELPEPVEGFSIMDNKPTEESASADAPIEDHPVVEGPSGVVVAKFVAKAG